VPNPQTRWRIVLPDSMLQDPVNWYHQHLNHLGISGIYETLSAHWWHPLLRGTIEHIILTCDPCQRYKINAPVSYGELPARQANVAPWQEVCVDTIGPWNIKIGNENIQFNALTCIDPVTNLVELMRVQDNTAREAARVFENNWLARYPRPSRCVHDGGPEFKAEFFQLMQRAEIKNVVTTAKNPQANAICERMHQTVGNVIRTLLHVNQPADINSATELVESALATAMHSIRCAMHSTMKATPGSVVFHRDMLLNIPFQADLHALQQKRQLLIDEDLRKANQKRHDHDYQPHDLVLILERDADKLDAKASGPFEISRVHTNGTVTIQVRPNVQQRINIRRIKPYRYPNYLSLEGPLKR